MKKMLPVVFALLFPFIMCFSQGGSPSGFAIQGQLYANTPVAGLDDWFISNGGTGLGVLDTTGAASLRSILNSNTNYTFTKRMAFPNYSVQSSKIFIDALFARDYNSNGGEQTVMLGNKTKNGANPTTQWEGGPGVVGGGANDIIDIFAHARRNGTAINNDLWVYGAIAYGFTGGSHYFDYEFYQSDIGFTPPVPPSNKGNFTNSGNDEGHTAWRFAANGSLLSAGDVAVAMGFNGNAVTAIEVRIWVSETDYNTITPATFSWSGSFDKLANGNQYGYASISIPASSFYYQINTSATPVVAAPWGTIRSGGYFENDYDQGKFLEFGLNFTTLGVDNQLIAGQDPCASPFRKLMVKSRTGSSFTADLKDFLGPFDFLNISAPVANAGPDQVICVGVDTSLLSVTIPPGTYGYYNWTSEYGTGIISRTDSSAVYVNMSGIYYVQSYVFPGCPAGDIDTILVSSSGGSCFGTLDNNLLSFESKLKDHASHINWRVDQAAGISSFELEKSADANLFAICSAIDVQNNTAVNTFGYIDRNITEGIHYYRLKINYRDGKTKYSPVSKVIAIQGDNNWSVKQVYGHKAIVISTGAEGLVALQIMDADGKIVHHQKYQTTDNQVTVTLDQLTVNRTYLYNVSFRNGKTISGKIIL